MVKHTPSTLFRFAPAVALVAVLAVLPALAGTSSPDIVDTAVEAAGLVDALKGDGPLTVFAPTDEAFAKLPSGTVEDLLKPENREKLQAILKYHVVPGKLTAQDVTSSSGATTLQGKSVSFAVEGGAVKVSEAQVVQADVECSNGVIHVIDTVLLPN